MALPFEFDNIAKLFFFCTICAFLITYEDSKMENAGEHLVGQYLKNVIGCDFVECNLQTLFTQGEIDVVGINSEKKHVYLCEVATHLETGLQYTKDGKPDNVNRFIAKFEKNIEFANQNFNGFKHIYMLWTPVIRIPKKANVKHNQLQDIEEIKSYFLEKHKIEIQLIYNESYLACIQELRRKAKETTQEMKSPIMRFLQIEEKLKGNLSCN